MSFGLLNLGTQSLKANQSAISITGQNISNVNTDGYTRQRASFQSRPDLGGVVAGNAQRLADNFLNRQIWADSATFNSYSTIRDFSNEIDNLMASDVTSISKAMDKFFGALQTAVDDPVSLPNRELFIAQSEALVKRFNDLDAQIRRQNDTINGRLENSVNTVNVVADQIAKLNDDIRIAKAGGVETSELLDKRDAKLEELSKYIGFTTIEDKNTGEMSVFIGNGEPLVVGQSANTLTTVTSPADTSQLNIALKIGNNLGDVTNQVKGGKIGGMLDYRDSTLNKSLDELGRIAMVFADTMNAQHEKGMDLDGKKGGLLFSDINRSQAVNDRVLAQRDNIAEVKAGVVINDPQNVKASEYELIMGDNNQFTLIRKSDGKRWTPTDLNQNAPVPTNASEVDKDGEFFLDSANGNLTLRIDGFTLNMDSNTTLVKGDKYLIRPTRNAAAEIGSLLNNARQLALAAPLTANSDASNKGTGTISVSITDKDYDLQSAVVNELTPPIDVTFKSPLELKSVGTPTGTASNLQVEDLGVMSGVRYPVTVTANAGGTFDITDSATPPKTATGVALTGSQLDLTASFGITLDVTGAVAGDQFQVNHDASDKVEYYVMTDAAGDRQIGEYKAGESIQLKGFEMTIGNQPQLSDSFSIKPNTGGVSDNRSALLMSNLQSAKTIAGASYQDKYGQMVERVGSQAAVAQLNAKSGKSVLDANIKMRSSVAGVNLDEEAAKLVQFQQAYRASAQLIKTAQTIFDTLLRSV